MKVKLNIAATCLAFVVAFFALAPSSANAQGTRQRTVPVTVTVANNDLPVASVTLNPSTVIGKATSTATVTLASVVPSGSVKVLLTSSDPGDAPVPSFVLVPAGSSTATFSIVTGKVKATTTSLITASTSKGSANATLTIVNIFVVSVTLNPSDILNTQTSTATVTLNGASPDGNVKIDLSSTDNKVTLPAFVQVPAGTTSFTFTITPVLPYDNYTEVISASYMSTTPATAILTVASEAVTSLSLNPTSVGGFGSSTGTVTLLVNAPAGGWNVNLTSQNTAVATVPSTVTVLAGSKTATFPVTPKPITTTSTSVITAADAATSATATLTDVGDSVTGLAISPNPVIATIASQGTVTIQSPAPVGGWVVSLSSNSAYMTVPTTVTVLQGATTATFPINTTAPPATFTGTVTASDANTSKQATLLVYGNYITGLALSPTAVVGGASSSGTVTLYTAAGTGGWTVNLSTQFPATVKVPASVVVAAGSKTSAPFTITTTASTVSTTCNIAAADGFSGANAQLTIYGDSVTGLAISPNPVIATIASQGTITLQAPAPAGGWVVNLSSSSAFMQVPSTVTVAQGSSTATFVINSTVPPATFTGTVTASDALSNRQATLLVYGNYITGLALSPTSVVGGTSSSGTVTLYTAAGSNGWTVNLSTQFPATVKVPAHILVAAGSQTSAPFTITTTASTVSTTCNIAATDGFSGANAQLGIQGDSIKSMTFAPNPFGCNQTSTGTITLTSPAPANGWTVNLSDQYPTTVGIPSSVVFVAGQTVGTFVLTPLKQIPQASLVMGVYASELLTSKNVNVTLQGDTIASLVMNSPVVGGKSTTGTITLTAPAPAGGWIVHLSCQYPTINGVPATVTVLAGNTTAQFTMTTGVTGTSYVAGVYSSDGNSASNTTVTINPPPPTQ